MKKQSTPNTGLRKAGTTVISTTSTIKTVTSTKTPMLVKGTMGQGNGLWCINTESSKKNENIKDLTNYTGLRTTNPNLDIESEFEKKIIDHLKFQINDLNKQLISALEKANEADYNLQKALGQKDEFIAKYEDMKQVSIDQQERIDTLENTVMNVNEALSNARKEINRLISENKSESEKSKNYYEKYQSLMLDKERKENSLTQEINALKNKVQQERLEKENIFKNLNNNKQGESGLDTREIKEKELQLKINENNVNKLFNENCELRKKLTNEEAGRNKLNDLIKKKKEKLKGLKDEVKSYKEGMVTYTNDVKWNQDLVLQRDNQIKVLKEKIKKLEEEVKKANEKVRVKKTNLSNVEVKPLDEEIVPVKSRPFLFGPESPDF
jgi:hypothetical protein